VLIAAGSVVSFIRIFETKLKELIKGRIMGSMILDIFEVNLWHV
jgi:hypothetical protein